MCASVWKDWLRLVMSVSQCGECSDWLHSVMSVSPRGECSDWLRLAMSISRHRREECRKHYLTQFVYEGVFVWYMCGCMVYVWLMMADISRLWVHLVFLEHHLHGLMYGQCMDGLIYGQCMAFEG
jgi:hypothetical protein